MAGVVAAAVLLGFGVHRLHDDQVARQARRLLAEADRAGAGGQTGVVAGTLERYLRLVPGDTEALARYGMALSSREVGRSVEARERALGVLARAVVQAPGRADVRRRLVDVALGLGRADEARPHAVELLRADPGDAGLMDLVGRCEESLGRHAEAAAWYEKARARAPGRVDTHARLAALLRTRLGRPGDADRVLDEMVVANPRDPRAYLVRGGYRRTYGLGGVDADVTRALGLAPDDPDTLLLAAEWARDRGDAESARRHLRRLSALRPADARAYLVLAELELRAGRAAEAVAVLRKGLETVSAENSQALRLMLADALVAAGAPGEAAALVDRLREEGAPAAAVDFLEACRLATSADWSHAAGLLERARGALDRSPGAWAAGLGPRIDLLLGACYEALGDPWKQLDAYLRALAADPGSHPARLGRASALLALGRRVEAREAYRELAAGSPAARMALARLMVQETIALPESRRRWADVDAALAVADRDRPGSPEVARLRAEALASRGAIDRARSVLEAARDAHPDDPSLWVALASLAGSRGEGLDAELRTLDEARSRLGDRVELRLARAAAAVRRGGGPARKVLATLSDGLDGSPADGRARLLAGLAAAYALLGDDDDAGRLWGRLAAERPGDAEVRLRLFDRALRSGDEPAARRALADLRAADGEDGPLWRLAEAALAVDRLWRGQPTAAAEARARLAEVAARRPDWPRVVRLEAELALAEGDLGRAVDGYRKVVELGGPDDEAVRRLVSLCAVGGRWVTARDLLLGLLASGGDRPDYLARAADGFLENDEPGPARGLVRRLEAIEPGSARTRVLNARVLWAEGQADQAAAALGAAADLADAPLVEIAGLFERWGRPAGAEAVYRKALPRPDAGVIESYARFLARRGRADDAIGLCARAGASVPPEGLAAAYLAVAGSVADGGSIDPRVRAWFESAQRERPGSVPLAIGEAVLLGYEGRYADAEATYRRLLRRNDQDLTALNNLAWLLALKLGRAGEAKALADRAVARAGPVSDLLDTRAVVELALGNAGAALRDLHFALAADPTPQGYARLARAHALAGDPGAAASALKKARGLGLTDDLVDPLERASYRGWLARGVSP